MKSLRVFVSVVTFNSLSLHGAQCLQSSLASVLSQEGYRLGEDLRVMLIDNASQDGTYAWVREHFSASGLEIFANDANLGFAGGHNQNIKTALEWGAKYILLLNPDVALEKEALRSLVSALEGEPSCGMATPRLYRAGEGLQVLEPRRFDAAGMYMTLTLRHFDRGSDELDRGQYRAQEFVFGGTGACLLLRCAFVQDVALDGGGREEDTALVFPQLRDGRFERFPLFDEGFFAYREDADLSWRGELLGWRCLYVPQAIGYHRRVVLPERRAALPAELNLHSVRNRFLMQINNLFFKNGWRFFLGGVVFRNLVVIGGVCLFERSSLAAFGQVLKLLPRALARRRRLKSMMAARISSPKCKSV